MTEFNNNKFVPSTPKTFQVAELKGQQIKKSPLSAAARSKVINKSGSNYLSESGGYGPCVAQFINKDGCTICNFGVTAILIGVNGVSRSETISRPTHAEFNGLMTRIQLGWGVWAFEGGGILGENRFIPSTRAIHELIKEIEKAGDRHGHQTVAVTDKREWNNI